MLTPKNNLFPIRNDILARVAASFFADRFAHRRRSGSGAARRFPVLPLQY